MSLPTYETIIEGLPAFVRVRIVQDPEPLDPGDMFTECGMPDATKEEREVAEREYLEEVYWNGGPFAFIVERRCKSCGMWEPVDSVWGYDDIDCCREQGMEHAQYEAEKGTK